MTGRAIIRAVAFVITAGVALDVGVNLETTQAIKSSLNKDGIFMPWNVPWIALVIGGALLLGLIAVLLTPFIIIAPYRWIRDQIRKAEVSDLIAGVIGLVVGLFIGLLLLLPLSQLPFADAGHWAPPLAALLCGYLGISIAVLRKNDFAHLLATVFAGRNARRAASREERDLSESRDLAESREGDERDDRDEPRREEHRGLRDRFASKKNARNEANRILLDTSAIIDGRIADICQSGFITGTLVATRFVLEELQHIADSSDGMRRQRGRRGLEVLQRLQKDDSVAVEISDADADPVEVDAKLVKLARQWRCSIITNDFNLNRVAELQGVKVLNINELAHAVKPILLPGEEMTIKIMQDGKEVGQGVGYLDDGTMIVVEGGRAYMQSTIEVVVTRVLQTVAGRMIFAHPKQTAANGANGNHTTHANNASSMLPARRTGTA
ncbi:MAG: PIN domain-containing protein [Ktedonobacterales bacterium]